MPWSPGATAALDALRKARNPDGYVTVAAALIAWIDLAPSGVSSIHAALAGGTTWSMVHQYRLLVSGSRDAWEADFAAMAADPEMQRELNRNRY